VQDEPELGERIAGWREFRKLSQAQLAEAIVKYRRAHGDRGATCSPSAVAQWELNQTTPTQANLNALTSALEITRAQFFARIPVGRRAKAS
jgi:transcriptional regulator with XRE-family HTH domain